VARRAIPHRQASTSKESRGYAPTAQGAMCGLTWLHGVGNLDLDLHD
jgi:hypothetical protein